MSASGWTSCNFRGVALFDFAGGSVGQLPLCKGDQVVVTKRTADWLRGHLVTDRHRRGIFPASYVAPQNANGTAATSSASTAVTRATGASDTAAAAAVVAATPPLGPTPPQASGGTASTTPAATASPGLPPSSSSGGTATPSTPAATPVSLGSPALSGGAGSAAAPRRSVVGWRTARTESRDSALYGKIDRCIREWTAAMKVQLAGGHTANYHLLKTQIAQLLEWRRQMVAAERGGASRDLMIVRESVMRLVEAASQIREGLIVPVTDADDVATEDNTGVVQLYTLHQETQARLEAGVRIALNVTEQLEMETAKGLRGAPRPVSLAGVLAGGASAASAGPTSPASAAAAASMRDRVHVLMDVRSVRAPGMVDPLDLYFSLWDHSTQRFVSEDFHIAVDNPSGGLSTTLTRTAVSTPRLEMGFSTSHSPSAHDDLGAPGASGGSGGSGGSGTFAAAAGVRLKALFRHVSRRAVSQGACYLVCHAFRRGSLQDSSKSRVGLAVYRRPVGVGVLRVPAVLPRLADGTPQKPPPLVLMRPKSSKSEDTRFLDLHKVVVTELMAHSEATSGDTVPTNVMCVPKFSGIVVQLRGFTCPYAELVRPTAVYAPLLADVLAARHIAQPLDSSGGIAALHQGVMDDTSAAPAPAGAGAGAGADASRQAVGSPPPGSAAGGAEPVAEELFVRLLAGEFAQDQKFAARNVQVRVSLVASTGERLPCLLRGAASQPQIEYRTAVYYHCNAPVFNETVCVRVPASPAVFERSHLLCMFFHASSTDNKTHAFGFGFLPLANAKGVALRDGRYRLYCYRASKELEVSAVVPLRRYLYRVPGVTGASVARDPDATTSSPAALPSDSTGGLAATPAASAVAVAGDGASSVAADVDAPERRLKDWFEVETILVSNTKTSNDHLHTLQRWTSVGPAPLLVALNHLASMSRAEAMRSLLQVFNAVFDVLGSYDSYFKAVPLAGSDLTSNTAVASSCFRVLLNLLDQLAPPASTSTPSLLDTYMRGYFWRPGLYKVLLAFLRAVVQDVLALHDPTPDAGGDGGDGGPVRHLGPPKPTASAQRRQNITSAFKSLSSLLWFIVTSFLQEEQLLAMRRADTTPAPPAATSFQSARVLRSRSARHRAGTGAAGDVDDIVPGPPRSRAEFKYELESVLKGLQAVMALVEPANVVVPLQAHALEQYPGICRHLSLVFEPRELGLAVDAFLRSIPLEYTSVSVHKLMVVWELLDGGVLDNADMRSATFEAVVRLVLEHLNRTDEERSMCVVIAARMVDIVNHHPSHRDVWTLSILLQELAATTSALIWHHSQSTVSGPPADGDKAAKSSSTSSTPSSTATPSATSRRTGKQLHIDAAATRLSVRTRPRGLTADDVPSPVAATGASGASSSTSVRRAVQPSPLSRLRTPAPPRSEVAVNVPVTLPPTLSVQLRDLHRQATVASLGIVTLMGDTARSHYLPSVVPDPAAALALLQQLLSLGVTILAHPPFPAQWLVLNMYTHTALIKLLAWVAKALAAGFRTRSTMDAAKPVWHAFFELGLCLLTSPTMSVEMLTGARRQLVQERYASKRSEVCTILRAAWGPCAPPPVTFVFKPTASVTPSVVPITATALCADLRLNLAAYLIGPALELTYCMCPEVAALGRDLYMDMVQAELKVAGHLNVVERRTIDAVDSLVAQGGPSLVVARPSDEDGGQGDVSVAATTLITQLFTQAAADSDPSRSSHASLLSSAAVTDFLAQIRQLYAMLLSVSQCPKTPAFEDERTAAALTLILYLRRTHRQDMYTKYVHFLADLHNSLGNKAEAAHAQLLHADVLQWTDDTLPAVRKGTHVIFPCETSSKRLERLLISALHMFDEAQCWEEAVRISQRLRAHYTAVSFDYPKLAWLLKEEAELYTKLSTQPRFFPNYFLVVHHGAAFPEDLRDKPFIYRGAQVERITEFEQRLLAKWPAARKASPNEDLSMVPDSDTVLKVTTVTPMHPCMVPLCVRPDVGMGSDALDDPLPDGGVAEPQQFLPVPPDRLAMVPALIRTGLQHDQAHTFTNDRPFRKREKKTGNDVLDTWVYRTMYFTSDAFPCTRRRSAVDHTVVLELNPLENAVIGLRLKNMQLHDGIATAQTQPDGGASQDFTMLMKGVVDAAVSGGVKNFVPVLNAEYERSHPEIYDDLHSDPRKAYVFEELRATLADQYRLLKWGMSVHAVKRVEALKDLHTFLTVRFKEMTKLLVHLGVLHASEVAAEEDASDAAAGIHTAAQFAKHLSAAPPASK